MRTLRRLSAVFLLTLTLALSAFAGDMSTGVAAAPPSDSPATNTGTISTGVTGDIETGVAGEITTGVTGNISTSATGQISTGITGEIPNGVMATDPTNIFLSLLQSLLSLF